MKQAHHFPAISHLIDVMQQEMGGDDTQTVLNSISMYAATRMEHLLMMLHKGHNDLFLALAMGEGYHNEEMLAVHPDMLEVQKFQDAIMSGEYHAFV